MKKLTLIIIAAALALSLASCGDKTVPDGMQTASGPNEAFNLYVPKAWAVNNSGGTASAFYSSSDTSNVSMTSMMTEGAFQTLDDYQNAVEASLAEVLPGYEKISGFDDAELAGLPARTFDYSCRLSGVDYRYRQVFCVRSGYFYIFTYTSTAGNFESHLGDVEKILTELTFK
jgi:hypothetical protein